MKRGASLVASGFLLALGGADAVRADEVDVLGAVALNVDAHRGDGGAGAFVTASISVLSETAGPGEWTTDITLRAPDNYEFNAAQDVTVAINDAGGALAFASATATPEDGADADGVIDTLVFAIATPSSKSNAEVRFEDVELRMVDCAGGAAGADVAAVAATTDSGDLGIISITVEHGAADHLVFSNEPAETTAGEDLLPEIMLQDVCGNTVPDDDRAIAMTMQVDPVGGTPLHGDVHVGTSAGVASWTAAEGMNITVAAEGFGLRASADGAALPGGSFTDSALFDILPAAFDPANSTVTAADGAAFVDGVDVEAITVTLRDQFGNPIPGDAVVLEDDPAGGDVTIVPDFPPGHVSDANGEAVFTVSSGVAETVTFHASDLPALAFQFASVDVAFLENATDAELSTVSAEDGSAQADGAETEQITVTLLNAAGNPVADHDVWLAAVGGPGVDVIAARGRATRADRCSSPSAPGFRKRRRFRPPTSPRTRTSP